MQLQEGLAGGETASAEAGPTKEKIFEFIKKHPGTHLRQVQRELEISMGVIQYHLYSLERERRVLSRRRGLYKRFYPNLVFGEYQQEILDILSQETERDLLLYLIQNPSATQKELSEYAKISAGTTNWHMKRMIDAGIVTMKREGQFVRYDVQGEKEEVLRLVQNYHPSIWQSWADRFANALSEVAPPTKEKKIDYRNSNEEK